MTTTIIVAIVAVVVALLIAVPVTCKVAVNNKIQKDAEIVGTAEDKARSIIDEALKTAETKKREALLEVKEESLRTKNELEKETKERRNELQKYENRVLAKESAVDKKADAVEKREAECTARAAEVQKKEKRVEELEQKGVLGALGGQLLQGVAVAVTGSDLLHFCHLTCPPLPARRKLHSAPAWPVRIPHRWGPCRASQRSSP